MGKIPVKFSHCFERAGIFSKKSKITGNLSDPVKLSLGT